MSDTTVDYDAPEVIERRKQEEDRLRGRGFKSTLPPGLCKFCDDESYPVAHFGSSNCRSYGLGAPGGSRSHCTCDSCF